MEMMLRRNYYSIIQTPKNYSSPNYLSNPHNNTYYPNLPSTFHSDPNTKSKSVTANSQRCLSKRRKKKQNKTKKRYRKATLSYCSNGEEDFDEHSDNKLSAISNVSKSFVQERNLEIIENVYTSKKKAKASFISNGGKRQGLLGMIKNKFF